MCVCIRACVCMCRCAQEEAWRRASHVIFLFTYSVRQVSPWTQAFIFSVRMETRKTQTSCLPTGEYLAYYRVLGSNLVSLAEHRALLLSHRSGISKALWYNVLTLLCVAEVNCYEATLASPGLSSDPGPWWTMPQGQWVTYLGWRTDMMQRGSKIRTMGTQPEIQDRI